MKKMLSSNRFLDNICKKEQEKNYRNKLKKIKSSLSLSPPKFLTLPKVVNDINNKIKSKNKENNNNRNNKLNQIKLNLFKKSLSSNDLDNKIITKFHNNELKLRIFNIAQNNLTMYNRLLEHSNKSIYDTKTLIKKYKMSQRYKKNSCVYPIIDFFKNKRISDYNNCFSSKHTKLKLLFNNIDNVIKPKQNDINMNTYDKLFFSKEIKNAFNKKNKLNLNNLNSDNKTNKFKKYFKTYSSINSNDEQKCDLDKEQEIKNSDIIIQLNEKENTLNKNLIKSIN